MPAEIIVPAFPQYGKKPEPGSIDDQRLFTEADPDLPTIAA